MEIKSPNSDSFNKDENSVELIEPNKNINILSSINLKNNLEKSINVPFKRLPKNEIIEVKTEHKVAWPTSFFSSLLFNWLYDIIKNRTEDNPVKLSSLDEISTSVQSKHFCDEIMKQWYGKYSKKVNIK